MRTQFQYHFIENEHIYSAKCIRHVINKTFPIREGKISGLSEIISNNVSIKQEKNKFDLETLIPEYQQNFELKIVEENQQITHFISTNDGYLCRKIQY